MKTKADYLKGHKASGLHEGDVVKVLRRARNFERGWDNNWIPRMSKMIGKTFMILKDSEASGFDLDHGNGSWGFGFPFFVLRRIRKGDITIVAERNESDR